MTSSTMPLYGQLNDYSQPNDLRKLNETTERMIAELTGRPHTIGPEDLRFLEVPFLKPTCKNPKSRNV